MSTPPNAFFDPFARRSNGLKVGYVHWKPERFRAAFFDALGLF